MLARLLSITILCGTLTYSAVEAQVVPAKKADAAKTDVAKKPATKADLIKELITLMEVEKQFTSTNEQLINSFPNPFAQEFDKDQDKFNKIYTASITAAMTAQMKKLSESILPKISKLFETEFTAEELQTLVDFYKSPVGIKQQKLTPKIMQETMSVIQSGMETEVAKSFDTAIKNSLDEAKKQNIGGAKIDALIARHEKGSSAGTPGPSDGPAAKS